MLRAYMDVFMGLVVKFLVAMPHVRVASVVYCTSLAGNGTEIDAEGKNPLRELAVEPCGNAASAEILGDLFGDEIVVVAPQCLRGWACVHGSERETT